MTTKIDNLVRYFVQDVRWGGQLNKTRCTCDYPFRSAGYEDLDEAIATKDALCASKQNDRNFISAHVIRRETTVTEDVVG